MKNKIFENCIFVYILPFVFYSCDAVLLPEVLEAPDFDPLLNIQAFYLKGTNSEMIGRFTIVHSSYEPYDINERNGSESLDEQIQVSVKRSGFNNLPFERVINTGLFKISHRLNISPEIANGELLNLYIDHPQYGSFQSGQVMPEEVILESTQAIGVVGINDIFDNLGQPTYGVQISLQDPAGPNYYQISLIQDTTLITSDTIRQLYDYFSIIRNQNFQTLFYESYFFTDESFEGNKFTFVIEKLIPLNQSYKVIFRNLSKEWYEYELSLIEQNKPYFDQKVSTTLLPGYVQPSQIKGNIEGVLGCFGLGTERWYSIE
jgi:hypothetical protein